jgi:high-affinity Fe2+/Pb2+ permease
MKFLNDLRETIALYYQTNTELALWVTIAIVAAAFLLVMLISPAFRRFMALVIVISVVLVAMLINFGGEVVRGL